MPRDEDDRDPEDDRDRRRDQEEEDQPRRPSYLPIVLVLGGTGCLIVVVCGGAIALVAWAFTSFANQVPPAQERAEHVLELLKQNQLPDAYDQMSAAYRSRTTLQQFEEFITKYEMFEKQTAHSVDGVHLVQNQSRQQITIKVTLRSPNNAMNCTLLLVDEGGEWMVDQISVP